MLCLLIASFFLAGCTPSQVTIATAIAQTQTALPPSIPLSTSTITPKSTVTITLTPTITPTETPSVPVAFVYEGVTISCTCDADCGCLANQIFTVTLTIDSQGNVTGIFYQYLTEYPDIILSGTISDIHGTVQNIKNNGGYIDFSGSLNNDYSVLMATLIRRGDVIARRELWFNVK
jgi:hypothetical protein